MARHSIRNCYASDHGRLQLLLIVARSQCLSPFGGTAVEITDGGAGGGCSQDTTFHAVWKQAIPFPGLKCELVKLFFCIDSV